MTERPILARLITLSLLSMWHAVAFGQGGEEMIAVGEKFVSFELEAHDGTRVSNTDLDGKPYLLFFYPKADTPG
jgi:cytochrome oxidase Cu insertion factor (SCO1/SenC/PrrC family)